MSDPVEHEDFEKDEEDFEQESKLVRQISDILRDYLDGPQIIKEAIQNADDAKARQVKLCLDLRNHGTATLINQSMAPYQGPALLIFNDAKFEKKDVESLQSLGESRKENDMGKTGQFGKGFNSNYHLSDIIVIVSDNRMMVLDPHRRLFKTKEGMPTKGKKFLFLNKNFAAVHPDQCAPFNWAGCDMRSAYPTMIRLALRRPEHNTQFKVRSEYPPTGVLNVFRSFSAEAAAALLFLKFVEEIELHVWLPGVPQSQQLLRVFIESPSNELRQLRSSLTQWADKDKDFLANLTAEQKAPLSCLLNIRKITSDFPYNGETYFKSGNELSSYMVTSVLAGGSALELAKSRPRNMRLIPWGGVAALLPRSNTAVGAQLEGQTFCSLALPIVTGLPVHINGFFALNSSRTELIAGNLENDDGIRADWNLRLLKSGVVKAYIALLNEVASQGGEINEEWLRQFYCLFPSLQLAKDYYSQPISHTFYSSLSASRMPIFFTKARPAPRMLALDQIVLRPPGLPAVAQFVIEQAQCPLVDLPDHLAENILRFNPKVRDSLRALRLPPIADAQVLDSWPAELRDEMARLALLEYLLSDAPNDLDLNAIPLVPLTNNRTGVFSARKASHTSEYLIGTPEEQALLFFPNEWVDLSKASPALKSKLESICGQVNLALISRDNIAARLAQKHQFASAASSGGHKVLKFDVNAEGSGVVNGGWISRLWAYIGPNDARILQTFAKSVVPIIPTTNQQLHSCSLAKHSPMVDFGATQQLRGEDWSDCLQTLGIGVLDSNYISGSKCLAPYVLPPTAEGVLLAIRGATPFRPPNAFGDLTVDGRTLLREFLSQREFYGFDQQRRLGLKVTPTLEKADVSYSIVKTLPIWELVSSGAKDGPVFVSPNDTSRGKLIVLPLSLSLESIADWVSCGLQFSVVRVEHQAIEVQQHLLRSTGVDVVPTRAKFFADWLSKLLDIRASLSMDKVKGICLSVLAELAALYNEDKSIGAVLAKLPCVVNSLGDLSRPIDLFDPSGENLAGIFPKDDPILVHESVVQATTADTRKLIGIKTHLDSDLFLRLARSIPSRALLDHSNATALAKKLLKYLDHSLDSVLEGTAQQSRAAFISSLSQTDWITVKQDPPGQADESGTPLAWYPTLPNAVRFTSPMKCHLRGARNEYCIGGVAPTMSERLVDQSKLIALFKWNHPPALNKVVSNLFYSAKAVRSMSPETLEREEWRIHPAFRKIYDYLYDRIVEPKYPKNTEDLKVEAQLGDPAFEWIYIGEGKFTTPTRLFAKPTADLDLRPFFYNLPRHLNEYAPSLTLASMAYGLSGSYKELFVRVRGRTSFNSGDLCQLLETIKKDPQRVPESLQVAIRVVKYLALNTQQEIAKKDILVPNKAGVLHPRSQLVHNNMNTPTKEFEVHPAFTTEEVGALGIEFASDRILRDAKVDRPGIKAQGQSVTLAPRIKMILKDYDSALGAFKEFLQNAADSGATEFAFMIDQKHYPGKQLLFHHTMAQFQGPAIVIFNNSQFTPKDFQNVLSVDDSYKRTKVEMLGMFGQGINTGYHFSEIITFVSGKRMLCLDPSGGGNVYGATKSEPGLMVDIAKANVFADQFKPFELPLFGFDSKAPHYDHTLFRLPLRTADQAERSLLKEVPYPIEAVQEVLKLVTEQADSLLVFIPNITKVTTYIQKGDDARGPVEQLRILKTPVEHMPQNGAWTQKITVNNSVTNWRLFRLTGALKEGYKFDSQADTKMLPCTATVAIKLEQGGGFFDGLHFNGLAIPIPIPLPILINAPWIPHSSRTILDRQHTKWHNKLYNLAQDAYAYLLLEMTHSSENKTKALDFWPTLPAEDRLWQDFVFGVYDQLLSKSCFKPIGPSDGLVPPKNCIFILDEKLLKTPSVVVLSQVLAPLGKHLVHIPSRGDDKDPQLWDTLSQCKAINARKQLFGAKSIREFFRDSKDQIAGKSADKTCFGTVENLLVCLDFCLTKDADEKELDFLDITGLPFALTKPGIILAFGNKQRLLKDDASDKWSFLPKLAERVVDNRVCQRIPDRGISGSDLHPISLEQALDELTPLCRQIYQDGQGSITPASTHYQLITTIWSQIDKELAKGLHTSFSLDDDRIRRLKIVPVTKNPDDLNLNDAPRKLITIAEADPCFKVSSNAMLISDMDGWFFDHQAITGLQAQCAIQSPIDISALLALIRAKPDKARKLTGPQCADLLSMASRPSSRRLIQEKKLQSELLTLPLFERAAFPQVPQLKTLAARFIVYHQGHTDPEVFEPKKRTFKSRDPSLTFNALTISEADLDTHFPLGVPAPMEFTHAPQQTSAATSTVPVSSDWKVEIARARFHWGPAEGRCFAPPRIPQLSANTKLLKPPQGDDMKALYSLLGITEMPMKRYFQEILLSNCDELPPEAQRHILSYIAQNFTSFDAATAELLGKLRCLNCDDKYNTDLVSINQLYDPACAEFQYLRRFVLPAKYKIRFPSPVDAGDPQMMALFRNAGMIRQVTHSADFLLSAAEAIAADPGNFADKTAMGIMRTAWKVATSMWNNSRVRKIFIARWDSRLGRSDEQFVCALSDFTVVSEQYKTLCWTSCPYIPANSPFASEGWVDAFHINAPPLKQICEHLANLTSGERFRKFLDADAVLKILAFISENHSVGQAVYSAQMGEFLDSLHSRPWIPMPDGNFVEGARLHSLTSIHPFTQDELAPHFLPEPQFLGQKEFAPRMKHRPQNNLVHIAGKLAATITDETIGQVLDAKQLTTFFKCLKVLVDAKNNSDPRARQFLADASFPVPTVSGKLAPAVAVRNKNLPWYDDRIDFTQVSIVHPDLPKAHYRDLGIRNLSEVVAQVLAIPVTEVAKEENVELTERFRSSEFCTALKRLLQAVGEADDERMKRLIALSQFRVYHTAALNVTLLIDGKPVSTAGCSVNCTFNAEHQCILVARQQNLSAAQLIVPELIKYLHPVNKSNLCKLQLFSVLNVDKGQMKKVLDELEVPELK